MLGIIQSIMSPLIREWLNRNRHVDVNVLVVYLTSGAMDFGTSFLSKPIVVPTWSNIEKAGKSINWMAIL